MSLQFARSLTELFKLNSETRLDDALLNRILASIETRLKPLEAQKGNLETAIGQVRQVGLDRINEVLTPAIASVLEIQERGFLIARSASSATLADGAILTFVIGDESERALFTPSPFTALTREATPNDYGIARTIAYDSETGEYLCEVLSLAGDPGPHGDWVIGALAGPTLAALSLLEQTVAARDAAEIERQGAGTAKDTAVGKAAEALASAAAASASAGAASASAVAAAASAAEAATFDPANFLPLKASRSLIITGASIASGQVSSTYANSMAGLLTDALGASWTVTNTAVPGRASNQLVLDLPTMITTKPSAILIATTLQNDGLYNTADAATKRSIVDNWKKNQALCALMCLQNGITPILCSAPPNANNTALDVALMQEIQSWLESTGLHVVDFFSAGNDGAGKWVAAANYDGVHPNDVGHKALFDAIPLGIFERPFTSPIHEKLIARPQTSFVGGGTRAPLTFTPERPLTSYTIGFFVDGSQLLQSLWGVSETAGLTRLRTVNEAGQNIYALTANTGAEVDSGVPIAAGFRHIAIRYDHVRGQLALFHNGILVGAEANYTQSQAASLMTFLARADGLGGYASSINEITVHRVALLPGAIAELARGYVRRASLEAHFPLGEAVTTQGMRLRNLAPTSAKLEVTAAGVSSSAPAPGELTGDIYLNGRQRGGITAVAASGVDCSVSNYFTRTVNGAVAFTFSNVPAGSYGFTLKIVHTSGAITWPAAVKWPKNIAPTLTTGKTHLFIFETDDAGATWRGAVLQDYTG